MENGPRSAGISNFTPPPYEVVDEVSDEASLYDAAAAAAAAFR